MGRSSRFLHRREDPGLGDAPARDRDHSRPGRPPSCPGGWAPPPHRARVSPQSKLLRKRKFFLGHTLLLVPMNPELETITTHQFLRLISNTSWTCPDGV